MRGLARLAAILITVLCAGSAFAQVPPTDFRSGSGAPPKEKGPAAKPPPQPAPEPATPDATEKPAGEESDPSVPSKSSDQPTHPSPSDDKTLDDRLKETDDETRDKIEELLTEKEPEPWNVPLDFALGLNLLFASMDAEIRGDRSPAYGPPPTGTKVDPSGDLGMVELSIAWELQLRVRVQDSPHEFLLRHLQDERTGSETIDSQIRFSYQTYNAGKKVNIKEKLSWSELRYSYELPLERTLGNNLTLRVTGGLNMIRNAWSITAQAYSRVGASVSGLCPTIGFDSTWKPDAFPVDITVQGAFILLNLDSDTLEGSEFRIEGTHQASSWEFGGGIHFLLLDGEASGSLGKEYTSLAMLSPYLRIGYKF